MTKNKEYSPYPPGKTKADVEAAYDKAYSRTRIEYVDGGSFFDSSGKKIIFKKFKHKKSPGFIRPRLRSINSLEVGRSKVISSWYTILIEYLLVIYQNLKAWLKNMYDKIYPRDKNKIHGTKKDTYIKGQITFGTIKDSDRPIHNLHVQLWARTRLGGWRLFAKGFTDELGKFQLDFDFMESRKSTYKTFHFEVEQTNHIFYDDRSVKPDYSVFERTKIKKSEFTGMGYDLGNIQLFYWQYRTDVPFPRVVIKDHNEDAPEYYSEGRANAIQQQFIPIELTKDIHLRKIHKDPKSLTIEKIQSDYPENLTVAMEKLCEGSTRCDYWFGKRMMNGMNCATFLPDKKDKNHYWVKYFGSCNYDTNEKYAFPTVETKFKVEGDEVPLPVEIVITGPINAFDKDPFQKHIFHPSDGEKWEQAKRVVRVSGALSTECDDHFAGTHLNTEQFAIAARRNLRKNPVAELLMPHLKEVALINNSAGTLLIGPKGYIPQAAALSAKGIIERGQDVLGVNDWKDWKPMNVINKAHTYGKAENIFWEVVNEFVGKFIDENITDIKKEWLEIYRFSNDLVENSVPLFHTTIDTSTMSAEEKAFEENRIEYYHERYRLSESRIKESRATHTDAKSMSPITLLKSEPAEADIKNLKDACSYAIMMATFMHTWVNEHQYEDIGEVLYSCLGLRFGDKPEGIMRPESDHSIAPDLIRSTQMLWFSNLLSRTEYGFIVNNEEQDISPEFVTILKARKDEFEAINVDIKFIESRTNI